MPLSSLSSSARRLAALAVLPLVGCAALVAATPTTAQALDLDSPVVISEVYGGGGNVGATLRNDFIELYNNGPQPVDLSTWSVQYASSAGTSWSRTNLTGTVPAKDFYLVQLFSNGSVGGPLPTPNDTGSINMSGSNGKVALVKDQTTLAGCATQCSNADSVVDFVGYGTANDAAGGAPAPALSVTTSAQRSPEPYTNTGNNAADFVAAAPTPEASEPPPPPPPPVDCAATPGDPACQPGTKTIQDIQGAGFLSPDNGTDVERVAGIVTAVRADGSSAGFWIQQADPDASRTGVSSGLFVFTRTVDVTLPAVGDAVLVTGRVSEFYAGGPPTTSDSLSITEITPTLVTRLSQGNDLPEVVVVGPDSVPDTYVPPLPEGSTNVESITTVDPSRSTFEFWEALEGMRVTVNDVRVVGPTNLQFNEVWVTTKPNELRTPRGGTYLRSYSETPTGRLLILPVDGQLPAANVGDVLGGATTGPVDWSRFGGYMIAATTVGARDDKGLLATSAATPADDQLAIATYNVENLDPTDPGEKFTRLAKGIVENLANPDIVALEEIQDNNGATNDGTVAADQTLSLLTAAIKTVGGRTYEFAQINPVNNQDGGETGGNIRSAFLYDPNRVTFVAKTAGTSLETVKVSPAADGTATLSLNPGRVDPTNSAWTSSRKPLAGEFVFQGRKVIVVANHFNSKGGDQSADGRFQPPNRASEVQRKQQAAVLNSFVDDVLEADPNANVVLAGDFNDYQFSDSMSILSEDGKILTDLITTLPEDERYTYVFNGVSQVLDHIFVTKPVTDVEYEVIHNNAEFADQASDHDPQIVRIRPTIRQGTLTIDPTSVFAGQSTAFRLAGWYPNRTFTVALDGTSLGSVTTDATGTGTLNVTVNPTVSPGTHTVSATETTDGATASAIVTVKTTTLGTVVLSPPKVKSGKEVKVELFDWSAGLPVTILLDGTTPLGMITTDATGYAQLKVSIATGTPMGAHQIVVRAPDGRQVVTGLEVSR